MHRRSPFFSRLFPIGVATSVIAALTFQIAIDAREGGFNASSLMMYLIYGIPLSLVVAIILAIPMALIWSIIFSAAGQIIPQIRLRATLASGISSVVGVMLLIWFFTSMSGPPGRVIAALLPAALLPIFLAVLLTWRAFRNEVQT